MKNQKCKSLSEDHLCLALKMATLSIGLATGCANIDVYYSINKSSVLFSSALNYHRRHSISSLFTSLFALSPVTYWCYLSSRDHLVDLVLHCLGLSVQIRTFLMSLIVKKAFDETRLIVRLLSCCSEPPKLIPNNLIC